MSSSRYYTNYYNAGPYRSKSYNNYYSKASNRPTYSYQPTAQSSTKSPKSKARSSRISDSGRIPGPYSPTLGRKRPVGTWKAKKKEEEEMKTRQGEYSAESIEQELAKYQKGTFYFQEELLADDKTKSKSKKGRKAKTSMNGHKSSNNETADRYSKFGLLKTADPAPQVVETVDALPGAGKEDKSASNDKPNQDEDDTKEPSTKSKKVSSSDKKKEVTEDTKRKPSKKSSSSSSKTKSKKKRTTRIQPIVTVSPNRGPPAFAGPPPDYYYPGYNYGAPPPTTYGPFEYGGIPPPIDPYAPLPATYAYNPYGTTLPTNNLSDAYNYAPYPQYKAGYYADSLWYPYAGTTGTYVPQTTATGLGQDPYSTPKQSKRSKNKRDSANVDLTTPLNDDKSNGIKKAKMSPGRRVNKIQKQLEYYFSVENMEQDQFLREAMDKEGWVSIDTLLGFNRMKVLGATKELVVEAAFHSQIIEIEAKKQNKIRMSKYWKQYVAKRREKERGNKDKKKSKQRKSSSRALREKEKQLDAAEVNEQTIDAIVAGIEQKMERRKRRREQREKEKKKKKENENESEKKDNDKDNDDKDKEKVNKKDNDGSEENKPDDNNNNNNNNNNNQIEEDVQELIKKDKEQNDNDKGDPDGNDMVEID